MSCKVSLIGVCLGGQNLMNTWSEDKQRSCEIEAKSLNCFQTNGLWDILWPMKGFKFSNKIIRLSEKIVT